MQSRRKRIAILVSEVHEQYQSNFIQGFLTTAFKNDCDVCIFSGYIKLPGSDAKCIGEANIFNLVNYEMFDSVVVMPDTLRVKGLMLRIEKQLKNFHGKVLYVDKESKYYPYIMQTNYNPVFRLTEHLIKEHGYKKIAFLNGFQEHIHSLERERAFRDCMQKYNLPVQESWIFYGDYWYHSGERTAVKLAESGDEMPEAVVCANDYMAIGFAEQIEKLGYKVPEDIALVGYDSVSTGQMAPQPITSIPLASTNYGKYAADCILSLMNETEFPEYEGEEPIFIGSSCGCHCESLKPQLMVRKTWKADQNNVNYQLRYSQLTENLVLQPSFHELMDCIQTYTFQIREFEMFELCLNEAWKHTADNIADTTIKERYSSEIMPILHCGPSGQGADRLDFETTFPTNIMLRQLSEESDHPRAFFFTPLCFEDVTFGYAVISYGNEAKSIDDNYFMWLQSLMIGMECYRRNEILRQSKGGMLPFQSTDSLTGMFNYEGFIKHAKPMITRACQEHMFISILALDISGLDSINSEFGRKQGDQAIQDLSAIIFDSVDEGAMCCRLGNDEFIIAELTRVANHDVIHQVNKKIATALENRNQNAKSLFPLHIHTGDATLAVNNLSEMEDLVNDAVSRKNGNKISEQRMQQSGALTKEEEIQLELVKKILDENLFTYHFQPIVDAKTGEIYAYEALMRSATEVFVSPLDILRYATHLGRLQDVERATFFNVLDYLEERRDLFEGKKIFINSIPGITLQGEEAEALNAKLKKLSGFVVIELTEQTMADDETLSKMKKRYTEMGIQTAVDDYGTGYSNIVNLLRYMPDYVKIDRMLLSGIQDNPQKQHFVKDIVLFAAENEFKVLAEGIETAEELDTVIRLKVDLVQGYYTARPGAEVIQQIKPEIAVRIRQSNEKHHGDIHLAVI